MTISISTRRFEYTVDGLSLFLRLGSWEAYWNPVNGWRPIIDRAPAH